LMGMAGAQQHIAAPQVRYEYQSLRPYADWILATWSGQAVDLILSLMSSLGNDFLDETG
jgi:hypothetical protein